MHDQQMSPEGFDANISPFAFQYYAKDFYEAYRKHKTSDPFSPARFFLLTRGIELAAKSLHVGQGRTAANLDTISHDLVTACDQNVLTSYGITLTAGEITELEKANAYYKPKGFEYFWFKFPEVSHKDRSGPQMAASGWPNLPNESILEGLLNKLLSPSL
jgi:hypothetical protein